MAGDGGGPAEQRCVEEHVFRPIVVIRRKLRLQHFSRLTTETKLRDVLSVIVTGQLPAPGRGLYRSAAASRIVVYCGSPVAEASSSHQTRPASVGPAELRPWRGERTRHDQGTPKGVDRTSRCA